MKKLYTSVGIMALVLFSNSAFSQQKISSEQIQPILNKLELLGKQNPAAAFPLSKLSKDEILLYRAYKAQESNQAVGNPYGITEQDLKVKISKSAVQPILDKISAIGDSQLAFPDHLFSAEELKTLRIYELQNMKAQKSNSAALVLDKAYALDGRSLTRPYGTMPLVPPHTLTPTGTITNVIYADDVAGNGKLYALDNGTRNLVTVNNAGVVTIVAPITNIPAASTLAGLSWNAANNTMYAIGATTLYTINLTTGVATAVGSTGLTTPIWLEIDNAGNAFAADITTDSLYKLNLTTGASTLVGALGVNLNFAQEADFNKETNQLYMAAYVGGGVGGIYTVNTTTGAATLVGDTTPNNAEYTIFSITNSTEPPVLDKAFVKNVYNLYPIEFGTIPLTPPHTITSISDLSGDLFADDLAGDGNLYALNNSSLSLVKVYNDGTAQTVGPLTGIRSGDTATGLSWNRANNTMYVTSTNGLAGNLYTVNLATGALTLVGTTTNLALPIWLEIDNAGNAFSADVTTDRLYSVNLTTGAATEIGPLGIDISYAQDADFNTATNTLYMAGFLASLESNIYTLNTATGAATLVGSTNGREISMFTIANTLPDAPVIPPLTCGDTFLDSGGATGEYSNNEDVVTHFAPSTAGEAVKITFSQVEIEVSTGTGTTAGCWDYLSIYNGPTVTSPVLAGVKCGESSGAPSVASSLLSVGDSFTSTDPSGQLTVRFRSDSSVAKAGWSATVSCAVLAVDNVNANKFSYYPNPTSGILNISAANKIENIEVYNTAGQKVLGFAPNASESEINMSSLPKGLYLVKALVNGKVVTNKVIKK